MKSYLSVRQVVERLNGSVKLGLIYRLIRDGRLRVSRGLGKVLVEEDSLTELLEAGTEPKKRPMVPEAPPPPPRPRGRPRKNPKPMELW
jgi:hypothetical protein